jgi:NADH dehydrogenase
MKHEKHDVNIDREPIVETLANQAMESQPVARPRVIVVGAGFGGLSAARALANQDVEVLLLDRNNYHGFWPLLYQVATAGLEPESIAYPVRAITRKYANITFLMVAVHGVDFARKLVHADGLDIAYDYLVQSAGRCAPAGQGL